MNQVTLNPAQQLYVIANEHGYSCFGFQNARDHSDQIAARLDRADLAFTADDFATLAGYEKYRQATAAWGCSALIGQTYFDPGTAPKVMKTLESCRKNGNKVRLVLGNTATGASWLDEHDVVGRIGRSCGWLKVPLLVEPGESGGGAILTACVLCVIDWDSGQVLYRHPAYKEPDLSIVPSSDDKRPWVVMCDGEAIARFDDIGKAGAYLAFVRGATIEPRVFG